MKRTKKLENKDVTLSKILSNLLRHNALKEGLNITTEGFVPVSEILKHRFMKNSYTVEDIKSIVDNNDKQRFYLRYNKNGMLEIRANQGHSISIVKDLELVSILNNSEVNQVIHGTYYEKWNVIKNEGLSRMNRLYIHFANGLPNDKHVISGMRRSAQIYIYINLEKALNENILFYKSLNNVILSPGNENGIIEPKYFLKVVDAKTGSSILIS